MFIGLSEPTVRLGDRGVDIPDISDPIFEALDEIDLKYISILFNKLLQKLNREVLLFYFLFRTESLGDVLDNLQVNLDSIKAETDSLASLVEDSNVPLADVSSTATASTASVQLSSE
jgi:hypothetical protein